ncbi:MAG TPA: hypothetical protein VGO89_00545 [Streptomyces sp.]|nr:hypothetical protein [Streptomyces sp.]
MPSFSVVNQPGDRNAQSGQLLHVGDLGHEDAPRVETRSRVSVRPPPAP